MEIPFNPVQLQKGKLVIDANFDILDRFIGSSFGTDFPLEKIDVDRLTDRSSSANIYKDGRKIVPYKAEELDKIIASIRKSLNVTDPVPPTKPAKVAYIRKHLKIGAVAAVQDRASVLVRNLFTAVRD